MKKLLEKEYRLAWVNIEGDPDAGTSNRHATTDGAKALTRGTGKSNVQLLVLTPDARILHAVSGYIPPKDLLWELEQALKTWKAVKGMRTGADKQVAARQAKILKAYDVFAGFSGKNARNSWARKIVVGDRHFVRDHPLLPIGAFRTRMLTGGKGNHFGYKSGEGGDGPPRARRDEDGVPTNLTVGQRRIQKRREQLRGGSKGGAVPRVPRR